MYLNYNIEPPVGDSRGGRPRSGKWRDLISDFVKSGMDVALVENPDGKNLQSAAAMIKTTLRRMDIKTVRIARRGDRLYLIRIKENHPA